MTTLSCLVAWLLLYLFAFSSLSLCSIGGKINDDIKDGLAIGHSSENHAIQIPDEGQMIRKVKENEGNVGDNKDLSNTAKEEDPDLSQAVVQDDQNEEETSQKPSSTNHEIDQIYIIGDRFEDAGEEKRNRELESIEEPEEVERQIEGDFPDSKPDLESDPIHDLDIERSSQVNQDDQSGEDEDRISLDDTNHEEITHKEETDDNSNIDSALSSDEINEHQGSNVIDDPNLSQTITVKEDIRMEYDDKRTEDEGTNESKDSQKDVGKPVGEDRMEGENEKNDVLMENLITDDSGGKDEAERTEDNEEKREDASLIDQQIGKSGYKIQDEERKDVKEEDSAKGADEKIKLHQKENEDEQTKAEDDDDEKSEEMVEEMDFRPKVEDKDKDPKPEKKEEIKDTTSKAEGEGDNKEPQDTMLRGDTEERETKPKVEIDKKEAEMEVDEVKKEAEPRVDAGEKEAEPKVDADEKEAEPKVETNKEAEPKVDALEKEAERKVDAVEKEAEPKVDVVEKEAEPKVDAIEKEAELTLDADKKEVEPNVTDADVIKTEEMPSYDEWREKKLQQAQEDFDRELGQGERNPVPAPKFNLNENSKNHASADCGAKILGTNPEAQSASAILNINRDIYMINPCSAKSIWFIVELCEPIQVKLIELANYELFSCVPESFKVSISDRYPVREWHLLGTFVARDERTLQNFPLNEETMFAKYMKIEMLTFFGSEHFCPLSVLRVFGTSMVEEIDDAEGVNTAPSSEQDVLPIHPTPLAEDLKGSGILDHAKDAVFKFVEKAAKVLTGSKSDSDAYTDNMTDGVTEEMIMEGSLPDDIPDDADFQDSRDYNDTHNDKCNGQDVCYQENYSITSQHCCLSLFAQTAGSILICCKAMKRGSKPAKSDEETADETTKHIKVIQTQMVDTQATIEGSIQTSIILEPTPAESYYGGEERIKTSSPPMLIISTKASLDAAMPSKVLPSDIVATRSSEELILRTPIEQTHDVIDDVKGQSEPSHKEVQDSEVSVVPVPPPPTVDSPTDKDTQEASESMDVHPVETATEPTTTDKSKDALVPPMQTIKQPKTEEVVKPAEKVSEKDNAIANAAQGDKSSPSPAVVEAELNGNASDQLKDKIPQITTDTKEDNAASKTISTKVQEPLEEMNGSTKVSSPNTVTEKAPSIVDTNKTVEVSNGSFSPSASSLSGLGPLPHGIQKESVLMRLNNRIKTLEINMSLSGLYLEELSQRYRKQMDEMQKAFNTKLKTVQENAQNAQEARQQQAELIQHLEEKLEKMRTDLVNVTLRTEGIMREVVERHLFLMLCEVIIMMILFTYCLRRSKSTPSIDTPVTKATKTNGRKPVDDVGRRNSDGLLHVPMRDRITLSPGLGMELGSMMKNSTKSNTGSLDDLLIIGPTTPLREAMRQASEPSKQKNRNKNKGRHKNPTKPSSTASNENINQGLVSSSSSSSSSSLASTVSLSSASTTKGLPGATSSKHSTAGLLFKGSGQVKRGLQGGQNKQGSGGRGANQAPFRGAPETVGQVNGVYQEGKNHGVNGYSGSSQPGGKKNNQCLNNNGKR